MEIVIWIFQLIGILIGLFALHLAIVAFIPGFSVPKQPLETSKQTPEETGAKPPSSRTDVSFDVEGTLISAWLYLPEDLSARVPCIIMGNGLGGTKDIVMEDFAIHYQKAGFAVLAFDYRHFGKSEGEPRQLVWIPYQLEDFRKAITYARSLKEIDPARIALWGTSASGGHVLVTAAKDKNIACIVAQCPALDGRAAALMNFKIANIGYGLRLVVHGQRDLVRSWFGLPPHKIPIVGKPGTMALLASSEAYEGYTKLVTKNFVNEACARIAIRADKYRPVTYARKVNCPVLLQICDKDTLIPIRTVEETAKKLGKLAEVKHYPIDHFDIYSGDNFEKSVSDQLEFFNKHLRLT